MTPDDDEILARFPGLTFPPAIYLEDGSDRFNCVAWAAGTRSQWWDPMSLRDYWPPGCPRATTVIAFELALESAGYRVCEVPDLQSGIEVIALMGLEGDFSHVMKQLPNGMWTSKLGAGPLVEHHLYDLVGDAYGQLHSFMNRPSRPD